MTNKDATIYQPINERPMITGTRSASGSILGTEQTISTAFDWTGRFCLQGSNTRLRFVNSTSEKERSANFELNE